MDIIQYNAVHKIVGVLDNLRKSKRLFRKKKPIDKLPQLPQLLYIMLAFFEHFNEAKLLSIHRMQIWWTTRSAPGTSRMEARLVRL